jgi:hypothetical protein
MPLSFSLPREKDRMRGDDIRQLADLDPLTPPLICPVVRVPPVGEGVFGTAVTCIVFLIIRCI